MGKPADALTLKQARALMRYLNGIGRADYAALVAVLSGCGLRIRDALALRWEDLRDADGWREQLAIQERKTGKTRYLPLLP